MSKDVSSSSISGKTLYLMPLPIGAANSFTSSRSQPLSLHSRANGLGKDIMYYLFQDFFFFFVFLGLHSRHMEAPRIGVQSELKLQSWSCRPRPTPQPQQRRILNPLNKARDRTCVLTDTNRVCQLLNHDGSSRDYFLLLVLFQNPVKNNDFEPAFWDLT